MRQYILPENVRDILIAYLETKPYRESAGGIEALRSLSEVPLHEEGEKKVKNGKK